MRSSRSSRRGDADAYRAMMAAYREIAPDLGRARYTPLGFGETTRAVLARSDGSRWLRRDAMSAWEVIAGEFADEHTRAFMLWMSFMTMQPPERPGTGLLAYSLAFGRQRHSWTLPRGGSAALPRALASVIEGHGGVIVTGARGHRPGARARPVRRRRDRAGRAVPGQDGGVVHHPYQAPGRDGTGRRPGARTSGTAWRPGSQASRCSSATTRPRRRRASRWRTASSPPSPPARRSPRSRMLRLATDFRAGCIATKDPVLLVLCPTVADPSRAPEGTAHAEGRRVPAV